MMIGYPTHLQLPLLTSDEDESAGEEVKAEDSLIVFRYGGAKGQLELNDSQGMPVVWPQWDVSAANIAITFFAALIIFFTLVGNSLVIAAVVKERRLRKVSNSFVINLAVSDILVGTLVTPIALAYQLHGEWIFSRSLCDFWVSVDVTCCTASITNLCAISYDRYNAITQPLKYASKRTLKRALLLILIVWLYSLCIAIPPFFGWRTKEDGLVSKECKISQDVGYTFYSTVGAFYLPLLFMLFAYICIYRETSKRTRQWKRGPGSSKMISERDSEQEAMNIRMMALANEEHQLSPPPERAFLQPPATLCVGVGTRLGTGSGLFLRGSSLVPRHSLPCESAILEVDETTRKDGSSSSSSSTNHPTPSTFQTVAIAHSPPPFSESAVSPQQQSASSAENRPPPPKYPFPKKLIRQISNLPSSDSSTTTSSSTNTTSSSDLPMDPYGPPRRLSSVLVRQNTLVSLGDRKGSLARGLQDGGEVDEGKRPLATRKSVTFLAPVPIRSAEKLKEEIKEEIAPDKTVYATVDILGQAARSKRAASGRGVSSRGLKHRKRISVSQEKRAAKTLSIVMGCFIVCWLPFFIVALMEPLCKDCQLHPALVAVVLWLGYCNSALNPIIYTFFNKDFRFAFKKMIVCSHRRSVSL